MDIYNIPPQLKGDSFLSKQFQYIKDGVPIDLTGATLKIDFKINTKNGRLIKSLTNNNGITIVTPLDGVFRIDSFLIDMNAGKYYYDIQMTKDNIVKTYVGGTFTVLQDVTQ